MKMQLAHLQKFNPCHKELRLYALSNTTMVFLIKSLVTVFGDTADSASWPLLYLVLNQVLDDIRSSSFNLCLLKALNLNYLR